MRALLQDAQKHGIHADCVERLAFDKAMRKQSLIEPDTLLSCLIRLEGRALEKESLQGECLNSQSLETYAQSWVGPIKWQGESPVSPKT